MSATLYYERIAALLDRIRRTQLGAIERAGELFARAIASDRRVYLFGSGHSVIPVMDLFPRYGSFVGFFPLYDPRLMWTNVIGGGGARELLWLERREGYVEQFLQSYCFEPDDVLLVFSHGGLNAAPIEAALYAQARGCRVVTVSSHQNALASAPTHSSGKRLSEVADIAIDNCVEPEDSQVDIGRPEKVAAASTIAAVFIAMSLVAETGARLAAMNHPLEIFVSPNVPGLARDHNARVFEAFAAALSKRGWRP